MSLVWLQAKTLMIFILAMLTVNGFIRNRYVNPKITLSKQESAFNLKALPIQLFHLGHKLAIVDLLWIQTLIESDLEHYRKPDLNSWMFHRFNTISTIDPRLRQVYIVGGLYLSVVKFDTAGASYLYRKGHLQFPDDFQVNYFGGLHEMMDGDKARAISYFSKIVNHPKAPNFIRFRIAKLMQEVGRGDDAVLEMLGHSDFESVPQWIQDKLKKRVEK